MNSSPLFVARCNGNVWTGGGRLERLMGFANEHFHGVDGGEKCIVASIISLQLRMAGGMDVHLSTHFLQSNTFDDLVWMHTNSTQLDAIG